MPAQILIVDDHNIVRASLRSLLSSRPDWQICGEAVDGVEAVEKAKVVRPDVVLMDVSMPRMDGVEATRILRRELPRAKVVLVSQNDPVVTRRQAKDVGADAFVAKSDLYRDLISTIEKVLSTSPSDAVPKPILSVPSKLDWLAGTGELGDRIRAFDWSQTSLGSIDQWPQSLTQRVM